MMIVFLTMLSDSVKADAALLDKLITNSAAGDVNAFEQLYNSTRTSVYSYAMSVLKHPQDAEDVLHDCFVKVYLNAHSYVSQGKPMAWVLTIAKNLCFEKIRERSRTVNLTDEEWENSFENNEHVGRAEILTIRSLVELLGDEERTIVILHAVSRLKHREIAEFMNLPLSTVLSKYHRAVKKLRHAYLQDEQIEERISRSV